jgi:hypothetical protein
MSVASTHEKATLSALLIDGVSTGVMADVSQSSNNSR